jgi:hypothetical protein
VERPAISEQVRGLENEDADKEATRGGVICVGGRIVRHDIVQGTPETCTQRRRAMGMVSLGDAIF